MEIPDFGRKARFAIKDPDLNRLRDLCNTGQPVHKQSLLFGMNAAIHLRFVHLRLR